MVAPMTPEPQRAPASLSESWASISDVDYSHDEDLQSETTDAGSLIDVHSANDVQSIREDTPTEDESSDEEHDAEEPLAQPHILADLQSSTQSKTPAASQYINLTPQSDQITLDEPNYLPQVEHVLVKHALTPFSESEALRLQLPSSSRDGYVGTLHMSLSKSPLQQSTRNSFRLLLLGPDYSESLRASLVNKVADALVASNDGNEQQTPPSRYHIVPDSFGPGSQPAAAEVIPVDRTMDVDSFHSAILGGENNKNVILCNEQALCRTLSTFDSRQRRYVVSTPGWQQPDLAIILIDGKDSPDAKLSACTMMIFAKRLRIPMMVVRMDNDWNADFAPLIFADAGAHLCIEKRPLSQDSVLRSLPLDLNTFLNINPAQLGRHIAHLVQTRDSPLEPGGKNVGEQKWLEPDHVAAKVKDVATDFVGHILRVGPRRILNMIAIFVCTLLFLQWTMMVKNSLNARYPNPAPTILETINASTSVPTYTPSVVSAPPSSTSSVPLTIESQGAVSKHFEAEKLGNSIILIRTPNIKIAREKFNIDVYRKDKKLEVSEIEIVFPRLFSVNIDPKQAFGEMNVCFSIQKLRVQECVTIDFGPQSFSAWMKELIDNGEDRLQQQLADLHSSFEDIKNSERPRETVKEAHKRLIELERAAEQNLKFRWNNLSEWQCGVASKVYGAMGRLREHVVDSYNKAHAEFNERYQESKKSVDELQERVKGQMEMARLQQQAQRQLKSERMATSQGRAQQMVRKLRERMRY